LKVDPTTLEARPGIFGAGDVTGLGGFTHLAYYHGQVIAQRLRGIDARADHTAVPRVTFTDPEIASVGLSEAAARAKGIDVLVTHSPPRGKGDRVFGGLYRAGCADLAKRSLKQTVSCCASGSRF
jgi:pyruvate/2-oxoglutarate dehydrogenase complex dihydrolipoamide dehydrogenase (E3) component